MPAVRSQLLEVIREVYPGAYEGITTTGPLGEDVFSGPTPHPNEVLNLFVADNRAIDGILYGSTKGCRFVDGCVTAQECQVTPPDPSVRNQRVHGAPRTRAQ